ncbi:aspartate dehydrogenase domain-containing protein [Actinomycetospora sp. NBRC 106378]|uniref:aspartate dehydrogenase domain-containing protein n=1 Tax=Actinomycetospora sp. NBRC 106378 TaxID=3032208 RepID=UPI0024A3F607|nr:aspartate dehydrogenase domain-containing protein [Actinomycetospora sp. NBRC 106378]GLZ54316.1 putative L-aspartate dehydrogenase [Actinomycetospora sp. NBRC 106378]
MRVGILGAGPLGVAVAGPLRRGEVAGCTAAGVVTSASSERDRDEFADRCEVVVEAAGVGAVADRVAPLLRRGRDVVLCSSAALADPVVAARLARRAPGRVLVPSGAIGGLDVCRAATRGDPCAQVRLTTTKRSDAVGGGTGEIFRGSAREAALAFPRTANVAATLALATVGFDAVEVVVCADPAAFRTRHEIEVESRLGHYRTTVENTVAPGSGGRTSAVTAWSVIVLLETLAAGAPPPQPGCTVAVVPGLSAP